MTPEEMDFMAKRLKPLLVEELLWLAEAKKPDGTLEPVAFMLMLPDYNVAIAPTRPTLPLRLGAFPMAGSTASRFPARKGRARWRTCWPKRGDAKCRSIA